MNLITCPVCSDQSFHVPCKRCGYDTRMEPQARAASLYRAANACCDTDLKTAIELRQLAGKVERGEA